MKFLLYNPLCGTGNSREEAEAYSIVCNGNNKVLDMTEISSYKDFLEILGEGDEVYIFGGDGTLNRFVNGIGDTRIMNSIYYYPTGCGNDFAGDVKRNGVREPFLINQYIKKLPEVSLNGERRKFINGVGFGIDGYCCEIGDKMRLEKKLPDYSKIAVRALLRDFEPREATVIVDGRRMHFKKVWVAPTMFGSRYGGGMIPTPKQKRGAKEKYVSLMLLHGAGRLKTLMMFPSIFKGTHVKHKKNVTVFSGKEIYVKFDRPTPLQIDGETVLGVTEYSVTV